MEKNYRDAAFTGLKCGAVIAIVYLIFNIASLWLKSTPAMRPYVNSLMQPSATPYIGQPPMEFYFNIILTVILSAAMVIGYLATGYYAIRPGKPPKYTTNYTVSIGGIAGIAAFVPIFVANVIFDIATAIIGSPLSAFSSGMPIAVLVETFCSCLPIGIILSAILSAAGAWGYAHMANRTK